MALTYPLSPPPISRFADVQIMATDAIAGDRSPFSFEESFQDWGGQMWTADVRLPTLNSKCAAPWEAFLTGLRGRFGTFLLGDPARSAPRGTATAVTVTGTLGSATVTVAMSGTLLAGDMFQLGSGATARLYKVLEDQSGNGSLEIWPRLRIAVTSQLMVLNNPVGVFRLASNDRGWATSNGRWRSISFSAQEAI